MKYNLDLEGEPKRAPRVALHGKAQLRINLALLAKLAKVNVTDVKKLEEIESIMGKSLRALNEI
jgi:hypothetical protein